MDLERSVTSRRTTYWKPHRRGYTQDIKEAGLYSEVEANELVDTDRDKRTVKIEKEVVDKLVSDDIGEVFNEDLGLHW